jgi:hypothetical protein
MFNYLIALPFSWRLLSHGKFMLNGLVGSLIRSVMLWPRRLLPLNHYQFILWILGVLHTCRCGLIFAKNSLDGLPLLYFEMVHLLVFRLLFISLLGLAPLLLYFVGKAVGTAQLYRVINQSINQSYWIDPNPVQ